MTPEEWMLRQVEVDIVIFDEFHLYFFWGDSFRPQMWESFYALASMSKLTVLLTATWNQQMQSEFKQFEVQFDEGLWIDFGNQVLKTYPVRYVKLPGRDWVEDLVTCAPEGKETALIFCAYRDDVFKWGEKLRAQGYRVWTCVGGEARHMRTLIKSEAAPDYIISTTVLSHGVNLPVISKIYFFYELRDIDFWIQMVARGGRRGEKYEVFALERPYGMRWNWWTNSLAILGLALKIRTLQTRRQLEQWYSKAS